MFTQIMGVYSSVYLHRLKPCVPGTKVKNRNITNPLQSFPCTPCWWIALIKVTIVSFCFTLFFFNLQLIMSYLVNINLQSPNLMPANYGPKSEGRRKVGVV